jgi:hypothetical protein
MQSGTAPAKKTPGPQRATISLDRPEDVRYWTQTLGMSEERLRLLVRMHGTDAAPIRAALGKRAVSGNKAA